MRAILLISANILWLLPNGPATRGRIADQIASRFEPTVNSRCLESDDLRKAVGRLSNGDAESARAQELLINDSNISEECRAAVINNLISAMSKSLDIDRHEHSYYLWNAGAEIFGKL